MKADSGYGTVDVKLGYECDISTVTLSGFGEISRARLANIVMICDALVILVFIIYTGLQEYWVSRDSFEQRKHFVNMTDFTVCISHLPHVYSFDEMTDLAASLTLHIE